MPRASQALAGLASLAILPTAASGADMGYGLGAGTLRPSYASAYNEVIATAPTEPAFSLGIELGRMTAETHEYVYNGSHKLSELIWETKGATTLGATLTARTFGGLETRLRGTFAIQDESHMEDFDWLGPYNGFGTDWTHASYHEDTRIDHAYNLDAQVAKRIVGRDAPAGVAILGGVRHTDMKWTAYGGRYVYSTLALRDTVGTFKDGAAGISYQQTFTTPYLGLQAATDAGRFHGRAAGLLGMPVFSGAEDNHWQRRLNFDDDTGGHYFLGLEAEAAFDLTRAFGVSAGVRHERYTNAKGKGRATSTVNGVAISFGDDSVGASHQQTSVAFGANYRF